MIEIEIRIKFEFLEESRNYVLDRLDNSFPFWNQNRNEAPSNQMVRIGDIRSYSDSRPQLLETKHPLDLLEL